MPPRTQLLQMLPWTGGLNTSLDESVIGPNQLTVADNLVFSTRGSRKKRDGIKHNWDDGSTSTNSILGLHDFWYGATTKTQRIVGVTSNSVYYSYNGGTRTALTESTKSITDISVANPTVITSASHGLTTGDQITVAGANSTPSIDGTHTVTVTGTNTFTIPVNVTVQGTAGTWVSRTWSGTLTNVSMATYNNKCIIAASGSNNMPKMWDGTTFQGVLGNPPAASILREHQGRLWTNDKTNCDRIHFSPIHDHTKWQGAGDSGALDVGIGDGDPDGITAIFPTFKGDLFVAKRTKLYRISGTAPENYVVELVSSGIGCVSHSSVTQVDQDDCFFVSEKGVHSLATTAAYGDFAANYVSVDIQKSFNELNRGRLKYCWGAYLDHINSVAFALSTSSASTNDVVYLYNIPNKAWYRWPSLSCESLIVASDSDKKRFYLGTSTQRVSKSFNGTNYDISAAGSNTAISFNPVTGIIFPDSNPYTIKRFSRLILYYKPQGTYNLTANVTIDAYSLNSENSLNFSETTSAALLGSTFTLGSSVLGYEAPLASYVRTIDGVGHGVKVNIAQTGIDETIEIQGFAIEYEVLGPQGEVFIS